MLKKFFISIVGLILFCTTSVSWVYAQTLADTTPPQGNISAPVAESTVSGTVTVEIQATDNVGVAYVWVLPEGQQWVQDTTSPYQIQWDTTKTLDGRRMVDAQAYDAAGNYINMRVYVNVDNQTTTPTVTPTPSPSLSPSPTSAVATPTTSPVSPTPTPRAVSCSSDFSQLTVAELLQILPTADYYCTESIAQALMPLADNSVMQNLLSMVNTNGQALARRNAIRVIGRFAEQPSSSAARTLVVSTFANEVKNALHTRLQVDTADNVLQDAIWVLDSFFYPYYPMQPSLETISKNTSNSSSLRFRAIGAVSRLLYTKTGVISDHDLTYFSDSLQSDDYWIRAQAAYTFEVLKDSQLDATSRSRIVSALQAAYNIEQVLTAKVYEARALDRYNGNTLLFDGLKRNYETTHLQNQLIQGNFTVWSGLPQDQLPAFITLMQNEQAAFFQIKGSSFSTPLPGDKNATITLILFATRQAYKDYMDSFIGYGGSAGGLYLEDEGKLYTYQRTSSESIYTVEELIKHEFAHYLQGRYIYPGAFSTPGYFNEPKAWIDEGTAEYYAGMLFNTEGSYATPVRQINLNKLCGQSFRNLTSLLTQTAGYNDPGIFDYENGWSLMYYLINYRSQVATNLYTSFKNNTYDFDNFASIAGVPSITALESDWHTAMQSWCSGPLPTPTFTPIQPTATPTPTVTPTPTPTPSPTPTATPIPTATPTPTPSDIIPPTVTITSPLNNATVARSKTTTIRANATDASGIAKVEFYVNGSLKCTDATSAYTCAWLVPSPRNVTYTLQAKAYDTKGNTATNSITVTSR